MLTKSENSENTRAKTAQGVLSFMARLRPSGDNLRAGRITPHQKRGGAASRAAATGAAGRITPRQKRDNRGGGDIVRRHAQTGGGGIEARGLVGC